MGNWRGTQALAQELPDELATIAFNLGNINTEMLQSWFGIEARLYEAPLEWAVHAVDKPESLKQSDNGKSLLA